MRQSTAVCALLALLPLSAAAPAAQSSQPVQRRLIIPQTLQGDPVAGVSIASMKGAQGMVKATDMPDGSCIVWEQNSKLVLDVSIPGMPASHLELDVTGLEKQKFDLLIDETSGAIKVVPHEQPKARKAAAPGPQSSLSHGPPNDDCGNAFPIAGDGFFPYSTIHATTDGYAEPSCNFNFDDRIKNDVWFCWTAPCTGTATITDCHLALGDSRIAVYDGCACPAEEADPIACGDDQCGPFNLNSYLTFDAVAGQDYMIRVGNFPYPFILIPAVGLMHIECEPAMDNDDCENATPLPIPGWTLGSTENATGEKDLDPCGTAITAPGVWYEVLGTGTTMTATTCSDKTNYDTKLNVFCRDCGPDLVCVDGDDDDDNCGTASTVSWCSQEGAVYRILVSGFGGQTGNFELHVTADETPCHATVRCIFKGASCDGDSCEVVYEHEAEDGQFFGDLTDCCGTGVCEVNYCNESLEDICLTGTNLGLGDDGGDTVNLGFAFDYFGEQFFEVGVSANGYCAFGGADLGDWTPSAIPSQDDPDGIVAPFWADWNPAAGGKVSSETRGVPGARRCIIQWTDVPQFNEGGAYTFQAVFFEGTNEIHFRYGNMGPEFNGAGFPHSTGIENRYGSHGYGLPAPMMYMEQPILGLPLPCDNVNTCIEYVPAEAPLCGDGSPLVLNQEVFFSHLDGGPYDLDGVSNQVFKTNDLTISTVVLIDVNHATFEVQGDLIINGAIFHDDTTLIPNIGHCLTFHVCEDMSIIETGLVRSYGYAAAGDIDICVGGSFWTNGPAGIQTRATQLQGGDGGSVSIVARDQIEIRFQGFISTDALHAGDIDLAACSGAADAIGIHGSLEATGEGLGSTGGDITVAARMGGIAITGGQPIGATGEGMNGSIELFAGLEVVPDFGPFTDPVADIFDYFPIYVPCECGEHPVEEVEEE